MTDQPEHVRDPVIELLAMTLHTHECIRNKRAAWPCWQKLTPDERAEYRAIADGRLPLLTEVLPPVFKPAKKA